MKSRDLAAIVVATVICGIGYTAYVVRDQGNVCPRPSATSVASLFAPCQAFDTAIGHSVSRPQAVQMGLLAPVEQVSPQATRLARQERATVGQAR
ncbi:hypothetical protein ABIB87_009024 [Bradyrhizobium sp. JR18.2]